MQVLTPQIIQQRFLDTIEDDYERNFLSHRFEQGGFIPREYLREYMEFGLAELRKELSGQNEKSPDAVSGQ